MRLLQNCCPNAFLKSGWMVVFLMAVVHNPLKGQVTVYSETFNNGCAANCRAVTYGGWTVQDNIGGTNGSSPNDWFVSCAEEGVVPPGCGSSCVGDASLHIGADPGGGGDMGASYNETGAVNATFRRAVSPTINLTGYSSNTLTFDFIAFGSSACSDDHAKLNLSTDNGVTWPITYQYCLTSSCCGSCDGYSQGQWTVYTLALPAAFNNNPNVRIGFQWRNNGNGSGTDPSVAIDDIRIRTVIAPVNLVAFHALEDNGAVRLDWTSTGEYKLKQYEIERGTDPTKFQKVATLAAKGNQPGRNVQYIHRDPIGESSTLYYRLKMVDLEGTFDYSHIVRVQVGEKAALDYSSVSFNAGDQSLRLNLWSVDNLPVEITLLDLQSKKLKQVDDFNLLSGENLLKFDAHGLPSGTYLVQVQASRVPEGYQPVKAVKKLVVSR